MSFLNAGEIIRIHDLHERAAASSVSVENRSFRVSGHVVSINYVKKFCEIRHEDSTLLVELELIPLVDIIADELMQFIGDVRLYRSDPKDFDGNRPQFYLHARVARSCEGLDLNLFFQAINARKGFLMKEGIDF